MRKSQVATEFLVFVSIAMMISIVFTAASFSKAKELGSRKEFFLVKDTAAMIQNELTTASQVESGYYRTFEVPEKLGNKEYNITIKGRILTVWTESQAYSVGLPNTTGKIAKGANSIRKEGNEVFIY
ncbi:hypothetical protein J4212_02025 [Candidatus Woesearchaeota archaeon]|nr:hypothetical protein [Candidatus Woesearchaeota archaeon]